jgi:hypothetical protein
MIGPRLGPAMQPCSCSRWRSFRTALSPVSTLSKRPGPSSRTPRQWTASRSARWAEFRRPGPEPWRLYLKFWCALELPPRSGVAFVRMIPKRDSADRQPFVLFRSLVRIAGKLLGRMAKAWVASHPCAALASAPSRQPADAVYRSQVRWFIGDHKHCAEILLDVRRCFDNVDRRQLKQLAEGAGYPVLALHFSAYMNAEVRRLL